MPTAVERRAAMTWAQRLKRVFGIDIETCPGCAGAVRIIACIEDHDVIDKILTHRCSAQHSQAAQGPDLSVATLLRAELCIPVTVRDRLPFDLRHLTGPLSLLYFSLNFRDFGAPGGTRTPDHLVRSQVLYPAELQARSRQRHVTP